jgi:acetyl esterase/lipase
MTIRHVLRGLFCGLAAVLIVAAVVGGSTWKYLHPAVERKNAVVYGVRDGRNLTLDILRPAKPNGLGVASLVSGGWKSAEAGSFQSWIAAPLLRQGYTIFAVYHISQPTATVMQIVEDMNRAIRFIRHNAQEFRVDPHRIGVTGGSAGGHLSLMLATRGQTGPAEALDPVDRESSSVQAVAIFFPVTDLLNLGPSTENRGDGGPPKSFVKAFGPQSTNLAVWKVIGHDTSPIYYVHSNLPPTLIFHGDADTLVPLEQSIRYEKEVRKSGGTIRVIAHHGGKHGWWTMIWDIRQFAAWFDRYLRNQSNGLVPARV